MTHHELLTLFDPTTLRVFGVVVKERAIRFKDLLEALELEDADREEVAESLGRLEEAHLVKSRDVPEAVEDFRWYYVTEDGLTAERELRRLELVT